MKPKLVIIVLAALFGLWSSDIAHAQFSNSDFKGTYAFGYSGTALTPSTAPIAGSGIFDADGTGRLNGKHTFNAGGLVCVGTLSGFYSVSSDGSGTASTVFTPDPDQPGGCTTTRGEIAFVLSDSDNRLDFTATDSFQVTSGTAIKQ